MNNQGERPTLARGERAPSGNSSLYGPRYGDPEVEEATRLDQEIIALSARRAPRGIARPGYKLLPPIP